MTLDSPAPSIILVKPQMGENIGASARAMLNCGLKDMKLVAPRDGWPNDRAISNGVGAFDQMSPVTVYDDVEQAVKDKHYIYATTARPRDMVKPVMTAKSAAQDMLARVQAGQKIGILFGGERAGLSNEDIAHADAIITIPLNPEFSSLNLAQGVLLCAYEWAQLTEFQAPGIETPKGDSFPVKKEDFDSYINRLEEELETHGFFRNPDMRPTLMRNIRTLLSRAQPTNQEVRTLQGILSALIGKKSQQ
ncbi:MAG: RNA methyltransferase [Pseudomonadota bacterium]